MQGYNLEIRHIPGKRNPADTLSRQDKKDALGRKTAVHDANANLVRELRVPSDADDQAIQEALIKLFNAQAQDQSETVAEEGQAIRAKSTDQALKAQTRTGHQGSSFSFRFDPVQFKFSPRVQAFKFRISSVQANCTSIKQQYPRQSLYYSSSKKQCKNRKFFEGTNAFFVEERDSLW